MAFLQSAPPRQPFFRAPPVVLWLIGGLTVLHLARVARPDDQADAAVYEFGLYPLRYSRAFLESHMANPGTVWERAVPFVSYMGLHNDWTHLIVNCLFLLAFGPIVARRFGTALFLLFFAVCGVMGALAYLAFNWESPVPVVGASGAVSGLMAAALRMLPSQAPWAVPGETPLAPLLSRQLLIFTALWIAINLLTGITGLGMGGENGLIAWQAHLGGFAAGLLLCGPFDRLRPRAVGTPLDR
ncbi:MAG TPA: rhomboid family intramembrane serine protease [Rhizomicrobium sp.]|nr:rhomboid family intramembrane serine protease [Rhizomicrobium sp.]